MYIRGFFNLKQFENQSFTREVEPGRPRPDPHQQFIAAAGASPR